MFTNRKMAHIGLATNHLAEDVRWYQQVLGLKKVGEFSTPSGEPVCFLEGNGYLYEMYQPAVPVPEEKVGTINHVALESLDIERDYQYCVTQGYSISSEGIEEIPGFWKKGIRYFKITSPSGEEVEFCQIL